MMYLIQIILFEIHSTLFNVMNYCNITYVRLKNDINVAYIMLLISSSRHLLIF